MVYPPGVTRWRNGADFAIRATSSTSAGASAVAKPRSSTAPSSSGSRERGKGSLSNREVIACDSLSYEFADVCVVLVIEEIRRVADHVAISKRCAKRHTGAPSSSSDPSTTPAGFPWPWSDPPDPNAARSRGSPHRTGLYSWNFRAPPAGCMVSDPARPCRFGIDRGGQQKPDSFDAPGDGSNRCRIHIGASGQKIDSPQDVVRPHRRQVAPDLVGPGVGQPISDEWPLTFPGRIAKFQFENHSPGLGDPFRQRVRGWNRIVTRLVRHQQHGRLPVARCRGT